MIIIPPTLFSLSVAALLQNMVLRAKTHMGRPALGGFMIKAGRVYVCFNAREVELMRAQGFSALDQYRRLGPDMIHEL